MEKLYAVVNQDWRQIVGVYDMAGLECWLRQMERNELFVERDGPFESFSIDKIEHKNHTRVDDSDLSACGFNYGTFGPGDLRNNDVMWVNVPVGPGVAHSEHGAFQEKPRVMTTEAVLDAVRKL